ncbi:MAG: AAA family ATPase, partial [Candidatus Heimdallarchaeota archaeon]|nr:AAA family ATPase [Candidatus Heimdallarchaeota archaeon]MCK4955786.1 AAA family ATPase [Candidatus Heimdallarchaeota archaeon]
MEILKTGIQNFDEILSGGFPLNSLNFIAGPPGTGKTILIHQLLFNNPGKALYITTLSEPMSKVIKFMQSFDFFDSSVFNEKIVYRDIGSMLRTTSIEEAYENITELLKEIQPDILCIDSFKAIRDLAQSEYEFRRFCYDLAVQLAVLNCTTFYVGEYQIEDITKSPEFAIADGIIYLYTDDFGGDQQRQLKIVKMRGREISITPFPFVITSKGIKILAPILELKKKKMKLGERKQKTEIGIKGLDAILKGGVPKGSSILLSGVAGTGKTTLGIQFICKGTERNEKGLFISTEEDSDRIKEIALGYGCNFDKLEKEKMIKIIYFPQDEMNVNRNLDDIKNTMDKFQPDRVVMDSFSVFLHKVKETSSQRIKAFELSSIVKNYGSTSLYISDIQAGENTISRFGVEETVMDGVIVLS